MEDECVIIYDFDGTLTPYSLPKYEILKNCGYDESEFMSLVKDRMKKDNTSLYIAYFDVYREVLENYGLAFNKDNACYGASQVKFNSGVNDYFRDLQYNNTGLKHIVITSGLKVYVDNTSIAQYLDGIFGTEFNEINGLYTDILELMTSDRKVDVIKSLQDTTNTPFENIIYIGDGLTDKDAFCYVHKNGGKAILLCDDKESDTYKQLNKDNIIDECFPQDFNRDSMLYDYIRNKIILN